MGVDVDVLAIVPGRDDEEGVGRGADRVEDRLRERRAGHTHVDDTSTVSRRVRDAGGDGRVRSRTVEAEHPYGHQLRLPGDANDIGRPWTRRVVVAACSDRSRDVRTVAVFVLWIVVVRDRVPA